MAKWHSLLEFLQFPLKILFIATLMLGIGSAITNPNVAFLYSVSSPTVIRICEILKYAGGFLINLFPLLVFLKILARKFEANVPVVLGFVSYVVINITMIFFVKTTYDSYFYKEFLGISVNFDNLKILGASGDIIPYNIGIFSLIAAYWITMMCYKESRHHSIFGIFQFIDHDSWACIMIILLSTVCGLGFAWIWPYVIQGLNYFFDLIAADRANPINLFLYGIFERFSAILGLGDIPRSVFWFSERGGSWINEFGMKFYGDVNIWTAQKNNSIINTTTGSFITPYYVINMFLIPSFYIAYYSLCSNKKDRKRYLFFFIIAIALSFICGNPLPAEVLMLILSPLLYIAYLVIVGLLYAFLHIMDVTIGYHFTSSLLIATPGSSLDLLQYLRSPALASAIQTLLFVGITVGIVFYFLTRVYFKRYAFGLFDIDEPSEYYAQVVEAFGGIENIINVDSTPDKLVVDVKQRELVDFVKLQELGTYLILESKNGYLIRLGNQSTMIALAIRPMLERN